MTDPTGRNRLDEEQSPYLRQHADNPVNWQPWDEAALDAARERDVPIFLSIGYSACHWCHVMADESFEDDAVAELLNEEFVPIKVDREERPDLDGVYQSICQLVSGRGGWPLSVWLTPEGKPFFVGTYFPPESRQGMPGFLDLLRDLSRSWEEDRDEIENRADQWTAAVRDELEDTPEQPGELDDELLGSAAQAALRSADREYGGFGSGGPKFPQPTRLDLLMRTYARTGRDQTLAVVTETLDAMATGGLYDHVGGGFHRYATDREWTVPHFEKMLYDNAELPRVYLDAYRLTGRPRYATVAQETLAFVERELTHEDGGFYSTLDAQSEGEEGKFYVWTPDSVREAVDDETTADLVCERYGVTKSGNFEHGTTVLTLAESIESLAEEYDLDPADVEERLMDARTALYEAREERERPARDEKILAGWNGLMISGFAAGARTLDPALAATGEAALTFVREHLWDDDARRLSRRFKSGDVKGSGYLEDYAFLARGAFDLYQATGDVDHLAFALDLARVIEAEFWDGDEKTLYFTPESGETLVARPQERRDQSTPSSLGVAVSVLLDLDHFAPDAEFGHVAEAVLSTHANRLRGSPLEHGSLVLAAEKQRRGALELTVAADELPEDWWEALASRYLPATILTQRPKTDAELDSWLEALGVDETPAIWAGREAVDGEPTVYACENFTCSPPQADIRSALDWALENGDGN
ncbi:thioredoxin domain-containing protein [Haloprofundus halophilus]|uniref:thioredoxin domain-containing protein n=1 Tax=Haloprofundus halophilus TaxID=2283527 RepID=UPI000E43A940|nr:thioredoxin domain-containing protein [Haloprofundus halophilus]